MIRDALRGFLLAVLAVALGCGIVWWAVSSWTSLSSRSIHAGMIAPLFGLHAGLVMADTKDPSYRSRLRIVFTLAATVVCTAGNYLAFVITSRTWFAARIAPEHQDFFYQLLHPDVLPAFVEKSTSGSGSQQTWHMALVVGLFAGPLAFWFTSRRN